MCVERPPLLHRSRRATSAANRCVLPAVALALGCAAAIAAAAAELPEYRLKAAVIYNFIVYTEWPVADADAPLNLCIAGADPFGTEIDGLAGRAAAERRIAVQRKAAGESLKSCQVVFLPPAAMAALPQELGQLRGLPVLTVADSPGAARQGVHLNMTLRQGKISFEANLGAARAAGLGLSSKLLRLATEVYP